MTDTNDAPSLRACRRFIKKCLHSGWLLRWLRFHVRVEWRL